MKFNKLNEKLGELGSFILPGGTNASAFLHLSRTIIRRAERSIIDLLEKEEVNPTLLEYINRLSDFLFTLARFAAKIDQKEEMIYIRPDPKMKIYTPVSPDVWKKSKE